MILAQRETSPAIYFGASVLLFHSENFWGFWNQNMQIFFTISQNNVLRNFLNLSSLIFLSSWTADFAKKAKRVSFNLYFKDARRLFLKLVNLIKISWLANIYTQYLRKKKTMLYPLLWCENTSYSRAEYTEYLSTQSPQPSMTPGRG